VPYATGCRALGVSQAWFYKWRHGDASPRHARRAMLEAEIARLFAKHRGTYGSPRITADLRDEGWVVSENTVAAIMREPGRSAQAAPQEHHPAGSGPVAGTGPDRPAVQHRGVERQVVRGRHRDSPDEGKLYLDSVLDMGSRRIVGLALGEHHDADLAQAALRMAVAVRGGRPAIVEVIMHTDQGSEYTADTFRTACTRLGVTQSMGRVGSALDNAVIESWHSTVEFELRSLEQFTTKAQARRRVAAWIEEYSHDRRHSALSMRSPIQFEHALQAGDQDHEEESAA
jgi:putative transposase